MGWVRCGLGTPSSVLSLPTPSEASGAIARFNTDLTENLLSAVAEFSASQASGTPTPASPIPIIGVDKVNITRTGKNLFNKSTITRDKGIAWATGDYFTETGSYISDFIPVKAGMTLSFSNVPVSQCLGYDKDKNYILVYKNDSDGWMTPQSGGTFRNPVTIPSGVCFIRISRRVSQIGSSTIDEDSSTMQIELGNQSTTYEAYNGTTVIINLGGTYFGGYIDVVTGKITLTYKKVVFNGDNSEGWNFDTSGTKARVYTNAVSNIKVSNLNIEGNIISPNASIIAYPDEWKCCVGATGRFIIGVDSTITSKTDWQTYLSNNNLDVKFELETPIVVYASNTAEISTIVGENQVFADSGNIAVKFCETVGHKI